MKTQDKWRAEEKASLEVAHSLFDLGLDLLGDFMPFWAILLVAVVALCAGAIRLFGQD